MIDKKLYKVLKFCYSHDRLSIDDFREYFGYSSVNELYRDETYILLDSYLDRDSSGRFSINAHGRHAVEHRKSDWLWNFTPIVISIIALIISFVALFTD